tara:strand:+ start:136 stop:369 length:234 start_codon:yes stop_codon:yes gene_type:complete
MPTYNYICLICNRKFVVFQNMNDQSISDCKYCDSKKVERIISGGSGLVFKGSGFYLTDYKNKKSDKKIKDKKNQKDK